MEEEEEEEDMILIIVTISYCQLQLQKIVMGVGNKFIRDVFGFWGFLFHDLFEPFKIRGGDAKFNHFSVLRFQTTD